MPRWALKSAARLPTSIQFLPAGFFDAVEPANAGSSEPAMESLPPPEPGAAVFAFAAFSAALRSALSFSAASFAAAAFSNADFASTAFSAFRHRFAANVLPAPSSGPCAFKLRCLRLGREVLADSAMTCDLVVAQYCRWGGDAAARGACRGSEGLGGVDRM